MQVHHGQPLSSFQKTLSLGMLYFVQGFPYGFQDKLIPLLLITKGHSPSTIALIRLSMLPWLAKALFAPLIDTTLTNAKWVTISLLSLLLISVYNATNDISNQDDHQQDGSLSTQFIATLFLLNFLSAIQDIAVDAIAIDVLATEKEVSNGNAGQIVGYKLGAFFGSGVLFYIYSVLEWRGLFASLSVMYLLVLVIFRVYLSDTLGQISRNHISIKTSNNKPGVLPRKTTNTQDFVEPLRYQEKQPKSLKHFGRTLFGENFVKSPLLNILFYVFIYKLGESAAMATFPFFLISSGVKSHQVAFWNGTVGMICSIFGSVFASQFPLSVLERLIKLRLLPLCLQLIVIGLASLDWISLASNQSLYWLAILSILALNVVGGLITSLTFTLMMSACQLLPESFRATRYTLMSTVEVLGKLLFSSISGLFVDTLGFVPAYFFFVAISVLPICFPVISSLHKMSLQVQKRT